MSLAMTSESPTAMQRVGPLVLARLRRNASPEFRGWKRAEDEQPTTAHQGLLIGPLRQSPRRNAEASVRTPTLLSDPMR